MGRLVSAVCVASVAGCAQLVGIDETTKDPGTVELSFQRLSIGATLVTTPLDMTAQTADWLVADPAEPTGLRAVTATQSAVDTWTADIGLGDAAAPSADFTLPDLPTPLRRQFDFPNRSVLGLFAIFEHPNPVPADPAATITLQMTYEAGLFQGEGIQIFTLGSWNIRGIAEVPLPGTTAQIGPVALAFSSFGSLVGRPLEKLTADDSVLVLRYAVGTNQLTGFYEQPPFDQTGTDTVMGTFAPVAQDQTLDAVIDPADATRRYTTVRPAVGAPSLAWDLRAAPGFASGNNLGPLLQAATPLATDTKITAAFGNPFTAQHDWRSVLTWSTQASRTVTPPGQALPVTLFAGMFQRDFPTPGLQLKLPAGLPQLITLDGTALSSDGVLVQQPIRAVTLTFATDVPSNTFYQAQVFDLLPNMGNTALEIHNAYIAVGIQPTFIIPPDVFQAGHYYAVRALSFQGGHPNIAQGDLQTRELPLAISFVDSGVFQVMP